MQIELVWDDRAVEHIAGHAVSRQEVGEVVYDARSLARKIRQKRYAVFGQTASGRYFKVIVERLEHGFFYPVTAYEMGKADRDAFRRRTR